LLGVVITSSTTRRRRRRGGATTRRRIYDGAGRAVSDNFDELKESNSARYEINLYLFTFKLVLIYRYLLQSYLLCHTSLLIGECCESASDGRFIDETLLAEMHTV
jgi:hypothetical protein